jgi:hypothetical protein
LINLIIIAIALNKMVESGFSLKSWFSSSTNEEIERKERKLDRKWGGREIWYE